jgi:hypothetical protein
MDERRLESGNKLHEDQPSSRGGARTVQTSWGAGRHAAAGRCSADDGGNDNIAGYVSGREDACEIEAEIRKTLEALARAKRAHPKHGTISLRWYLRKLYANNRSNIYT